MAEIIACGIAAHKKKVEEEKGIVYDDNLANYFALISNSKPRPAITTDEVDERMI